MKIKRKIKNALLLSPLNGIYYHIRYFLIHGKRCRFKDPQRFSEKIFCRMRYPSESFSQLTDKVAVREFIRKELGEEYLVPVYAIVKKLDLETWNSLPNSFVMKTNHGAGQVKIVRDKNTTSYDELKDLSNSWLESNHFLNCGEGHYKNIKPQLIFEELLLIDGDVPADYKVNVFNPKNGKEGYIFIQYMDGRFNGGVRQSLFLEDWTVAPFSRSGYKNVGSQTERPYELETMISLSKKIAKKFGYLRVDFYICKNKLFIGELTFTPGAGEYKFEPASLDEELGSMFGWPE